MTRILLKASRATGVGRNEDLNHYIFVIALRGSKSTIARSCNNAQIWSEHFKFSREGPENIGTLETRA